MQTKKAKYTLLSKIYKTQHIPLQWRCLSCQSKFTRSWKPMLRTLEGKSNGGCSTCTKRVTYTVKDIHKKLKLDKRPFKLLSKQYLNNKAPLQWRCNKKSCGHIWKNNWKAINGVAGQNPQGCPECYKNDAIYTVEELKQILIDKNINAELLSDTSKDLVNSKLQFKCLNQECGHIWFSKWANITNAENGCPVCFSLGVTEKGIKRFLDKVFGYGTFIKIKPDFLINPETGFPLEIDCYSEQHNLAIEIHGGQHYKYLKFFHGTSSNFKKQQKRDAFKKQTILARGINFIELDISSLLKIKNIKETLRTQLLNLNIKIPKNYDNFDIQRYHKDDRIRIKKKKKEQIRVNWNLTKIKQYFKKTTYKPILNKYITTKQIIRWECKTCNYTFNKSIMKMLYKVKKGLVCKQCTKIKNGYDFEKVLKTIKEKKIPLKCLSNDYKNSSMLLKWKCLQPLCNAEFEKNWSSVNRSSKGSCIYCSLNLQRNKFLLKTLINLFGKQDVEIIQTKIINSLTKSTYQLFYVKSINTVVELDNWFDNTFYKRYHKNQQSYKDHQKSNLQKDKFLKEQGFIHYKISLKSDIHFIDIEKKLLKLIKS